MGNTVLLTVRGPSGREWSRSFHGDSYGYDAALAVMTANDNVENVCEPDDEIYRLVYETTAKVARDRLACYGLGGASAWSTVDRALHERDESGAATTVRLDADETLAEHAIEWATTLTNDEAKNGERGWQLLIEAMDGLFKTEELWPMLHGLAVLTAAAPPETVIRIDMSDSDWAWEDHEGALLVDYWPIELSSLQPAALLCEGVFDARVFTHAIAATHPHLTSHLLIPDFGFDREGGSAALTRLVRGLASVGVRDSRIIAVFDADRTGNLEAERLKGVELPPNFTVTTLPHLRALERYPVIGPELTSDTDVNGWGAALETYLAVEMGMTAPLVLSYEHGRAGGYQGVLPKPDKARVQEAFETQRLTSREWPVLQRIVQHLIHEPLSS